MNIAVLGTGNVGQTIATRLVSLGHSIWMGSRTADNQNAVAWAQGSGEHGHAGTFADAAEHGDVIFVCTQGVHTLDALTMTGANNLSGKTVIDVSNPLDFSNGMPPTLSVCNSDSVGEQIQQTFPDAHVVKSLNTMNCSIMVDPASVGGDHVVFVCGNSEAAKGETRKLLGEFGWRGESIIDLGDITAARGTEMFLPLWLRIYQAQGSAEFNIGVLANH